MGFISNIITPLIIKALEGYLKPECIDKDTISLSLSRGHLELADVCIKEELIDELGLPFALRHGR